MAGRKTTKDFDNDGRSDRQDRAKSGNSPQPNIGRIRMVRGGEVCK